MDPPSVPPSGGPEGQSVDVEGGSCFREPSIRRQVGVRKAAASKEAASKEEASKEAGGSLEGGSFEGGSLEGGSFEGRGHSGWPVLSDIFPVWEGCPGADRTSSTLGVLAGRGRPGRQTIDDLRAAPEPFGLDVCRCPFPVGPPAPNGQTSG
jgi:hypothetical protein